MKLGVCVPYRNRELHLNEFIPKVGKYLKNEGIEFCMYFCHQTDDKLFNRGATKNIAAKHAFEDGCTHIVWHDIDMIPEEGADYSFPKDNPRHIATKISQMEYGLKYHEYFGGAVVFSKEQVEKTNGYSNNYWDWGMEDDDLFWRCHREGYTDDTYLNKKPYKQKYASFNGKDSKVTIPFERKYRGLTTGDHTISLLCRPLQQPEKNKIFLIGDKENKYVEYPIFRIQGYDYGLSFNNSRALSLTYWNNFNDHNYMWIKRYSNQWSWVTATFDKYNKLSHFYLNGSEVDSKAGFGSPSPNQWIGSLKNYGLTDIYLGYTPTKMQGGLNQFYKGDIAKAYAWKRCLTPKEVANLHKDIPIGDITLNLDFNSPVSNYIADGIEIKETELRVPNSIVPHRVDGKFRCLPHKDEGLVNGKWAKGDTTAANEKRYVLQMQQGKIDYKKDGIEQIEYEFISEQKLTPWAKMINIKL